MSGIVPIKSGDESSLLAAVYSVGPISVKVDGRSNAFRVSFYVAIVHLNTYTGEVMITQLYSISTIMEECLTHQGALALC